VQELAKSVGAGVGDTRLMLMASLLIADELSEAIGRVEDQEKELGVLRSAHSSAEASLRDTEDALAEALESATAQIEDIAARVAQTG
jgi:cell division protein ZapA